MKKAIVIYYKNKPVMLCELREFTPEEFVEMKHKCEANKEAMRMEKENEKVSIDTLLSDIEQRIRKLEGVEWYGLD